MPVLSRQQLYGLVWSLPAVKLAASFGISDVALGKICRKHKIPKPPLGYWAKLQHGYPVNKPPLPKVKDSSLDSVTITPAAMKPSPKSLPLEKQSDARNIAVPDLLTDPHPLVKSTLNVLRETEADQWGMKRLKTTVCLPIHVSDGSADRVLRIFDTVLKQIEKEGYSARVEPAYNNSATAKLVVDGEAISFDLREEMVRIPNKPNRQEWSYPKYLYKPSGRLVIRIEQVYGFTYEHTWRDGKRRRVEDCVGAALSNVRVAAEASRKRRLIREEEERQRHEKERSRQLQEQRIMKLGRLTSRWEEASRIRSFLEAVKSEYSRLRIEPTQEDHEFLEWVGKYADEIDPTKLVKVR